MLILDPFIAVDQLEGIGNVIQIIEIIARFQQMVLPDDDRMS